MYRRTVLFLCCSMAFHTEFCFCNAEDDWELYDEIPEGKNKEDFQDVYEFMYEKKWDFCEKNCLAEISMARKYIKKPPADKDKKKFCDQKTVEDGRRKIWRFRCRRREEFLNNENWISQTVADYLWDTNLQIEEYAGVFCVIKYLRKRYPAGVPTPKARFDPSKFRKLFKESAE
ncbi:unnamed protein product [Cylicocyclus nassatus]|uniref:Uncharacterized protein n=1 Tax=Cylicocyclus nassatus TaxID=53992 RepID=A0AA36GXK2_CYLNA|nr:unnamed protein product [Cylicocyclus nassatus]